MRATVVTLATLSEQDLRRLVDGRSVQSHLYAAMRREQAAIVAALRPEREPLAILAFAGAALEELEALLARRPDRILDEARDGDWSLRDLLRHAVAVELRYRAQILYSARRPNDAPVRIADPLLPCDRLTPPEAVYGETRTASSSASSSCCVRPASRATSRCASCRATRSSGRRSGGSSPSMSASGSTRSARI